jgi:hypothetical protein
MLESSSVAAAPWVSEWVCDYPIFGESKPVPDNTHDACANYE